MILKEASFVTGKNVKQIVSEITFSNHQEFEEEYFKDRKAMIDIGYPHRSTAFIIDHIAIDVNLAPDFFSLTPVSASSIGVFVSENIKSAFEAAGCTGILF